MGVWGMSTGECCSSKKISGPMIGLSIPETNPRKSGFLFKKKRKPGNPNPIKFTIKRTKEINNNLVAEINYPDCKNYEGNKICVYKDVTELTLRKQKFIDPHFCDCGKHVYPFARLKPTSEGWDAAIKLAEII